MADPTCKVCGRVFGKAEHLRRHERSHTNEKPYECTVCHKAYGRRDVLNRHMKGHQEEKGWEHYVPNKRRRISPSPKLAKELPTSSTNIRAQESRENPRFGLGGNYPYDAWKPQAHELSQSLDTKATPGHDNIADNGFQGLTPATASRSTETHLEEAFIQPSARERPEGGFVNQMIGTSTDAGAASELSDSLDDWFGSFYDDGDNDFMNLLTPFATPSFLLSSLDPALTLNHDAPPAAQDSHHTASYNEDAARGTPLAKKNAPHNQHPTMNIQQLSNNGNSDRVECFPTVNRQWRVDHFQPVQGPWQALLEVESLDVLGAAASRPNHSQTFLQRRKVSEATRQHLQDKLRAYLPLTQRGPQGPLDQTPSSLTSTECAPLSNLASMPRAGLLDLALDVYFTRCDPAMPVIHHPTFNTETAAPCLLLSLVLAGFQALGTKGPMTYVKQTFPVLVSTILKELELDCTAPYRHSRWLTTMSAALITSNLAIVLGFNGDREASGSYFLITTLLLTAQETGLLAFPENLALRGPPSVSGDEETRWRSWSRLECAKRLALGLVELDLCFSSLLSRRPIIQMSSTRLATLSHDKAFYAENSSNWSAMDFEEDQMNVSVISPLNAPTHDEDWSAQTILGMLTLLQSSLWDSYHNIDALRSVLGTEISTMPWRMWSRTGEDDLVKLALSLRPRCLGGSEYLNINDAVLWHLTCLMLACNLQNLTKMFNLTQVIDTSDALAEIKVWTNTPSGRRACLHAGEIFKILHHRRMKELVTLHGVCAAFWAGIVMGIYYLTLSAEANSTECELELLSSSDWQIIGETGLVTRTQHMETEPDGVSVPVGALKFLLEGGIPRIGGDHHLAGPVTARRIFSHFADLIDGLGAWRLAMFSQILRAASDDLMGSDRFGGNGEALRA